MPSTSTGTDTVTQSSWFPVTWVNSWHTLGPCARLPASVFDLWCDGCMICKHGTRRHIKWRCPRCWFDSKCDCWRVRGRCIDETAPGSGSLCPECCNNLILGHPEQMRSVGRPPDWYSERENCQVCGSSCHPISFSHPTSWFWLQIPHQVCERLQLQPASNHLQSTHLRLQGRRVTAVLPDCLVRCQGVDCVDYPKD